MNIKQIISSLFRKRKEFPDEDIIAMDLKGTLKLETVLSARGYLESSVGKFWFKYFGKGVLVLLRRVSDDCVTIELLVKFKPVGVKTMAVTSDDMGGIIRQLQRKEEKAAQIVSESPVKESTGKRVAKITDILLEELEEFPEEDARPFEISIDDPLRQETILSARGYLKSKSGGWIKYFSNDANVTVDYAGNDNVIIALLVNGRNVGSRYVFKNHNEDYEGFFEALKIKEAQAIKAAKTAPLKKSSKLESVADEKPELRALSLILPVKKIGTHRSVKPRRSIVFLDAREKALEDYGYTLVSSGAVSVLGGDRLYDQHTWKATLEGGVALVFWLKDATASVSAQAVIPGRVADKYVDLPSFLCTDEHTMAVKIGSYERLALKALHS